MGMSKTLNAAKKGVMQVWRKLAHPVVIRGGTAWPKKKKDLEKYGVRFDYDGTIVQNGETYHKFQVQPNAGEVPSSIKYWIKKKGKSTHAVMTNVLVKDDATEEEVGEAIDDAFNVVKN